MARDPKVTRKAYEYKLGKDLVSKLDDKQIHLLSQYYNSLSDKETSEIDSQIVQGRNNTELHEMAIGMVEENESKKTPPKPKAKPKPKVAPKPKPKAKPKKVYDEDRSVAYKLPDYILKDLDEDQIKDLSSYYNSLPPDQKRKVDSEMVKGSGDLMDLARQMSDPLQEKWNTGGLDTWTGKPKENSNAKQGPMPMPSAKKKPDKKAVTAIVKKFSTEKKEDTKQQSTNETIDPTILRLLGLEDAFDLDYDTYETLLREKMAAGRMSKSQIPTEETELLTNEFKRVKSKTGRFKPKKKSVNISKVVQSGKKYNKSAVNTQKLLSGSKEAESTKVKVKGEAVTDSFENINQSLLGIDSLLKNILGEEKKESEQEEKTARKAAQKAEEEKSEKNAKTKATKALKGFKAPKMGFLDMIKRFFKNILLGGFIMKALDWFQKEENQEKIQNVITFITDHMDKILLGIAALVGLNIGMKILDFLKLFSPLIKGVLFVLKGFLGIIPKIINKLLDRDKPDKTPKGNQNQPRQGAGKNAGRTSGKGTGKPGQNVTSGASGKPRVTGRAPVTTGTGGAPKPGFRLPNPFKGLKLPKVNPGSALRGGATFGTGMALEMLMNWGFDKLDSMQIASVVERFNNADEQTKNKMLEHYKKRVQEAEGRTKGISGGIDSVTTLGGLLGESSNQKVLRVLQATLAALEEEDTEPTSDTSQNKPTTPVPPTTPPVTPQTPMIAPTGAYDVIIPLDHAKKAGTVADDASGKTFEQSKSTGADGREREHQDSAAAKLKLKLEEKGLKVKIVTPEEYGNYADYDKFIKGQANKGVRIVPLHFDAIRSAGGTGFLTRTRAGDDQDAAFAAPITDALAKFQKENPELGNMKSDTKGNATVKAGAASPTALVELGVMTDWEDKYGKNFTGTSKFDELIQGVADGIFKGGGFPTPPGMQEVKPGHSRPEPPAPPNTDPAPVVLPLSGGGSGDNELSSASGGRPSAASFSSIDGNNPNPRQVGSLFNLTAV
jgi:cytochrome c553